MLRRYFMVAVIWLGLSFCPDSALPLDIRILTDADEALVRDIRAASTVIIAEREGRTDPADILAAAQADYWWLIRAMYNAGYYGAVISIKVDGQEAALPGPVARAEKVEEVLIDIETGPLFTFSHAEMSPRPPAIAPERARLFRVGRPAGAEVIGEFAGLGVDGWRAEGHPKARVVEQRIEADHRAGELSADIVLSPGPKATFGSLVLKGDSAVRESRIRAIADFPADSVYDPAVVARMARRMRGTGAFRAVELDEAEELGPDNSLDLELETVDAEPRRFGVGAEIDTVDGLSVNAFHLFRNLTYNADSLRVEGEATGLAGETSGIDYATALRYRRPATFNSDTDFLASVEERRLNEALYDANLFGATLSLERRITDTYSAGVGAGYRFTGASDGFGDRTFQYLVLPANATLDRREGNPNPRGGVYAKANVTPFTGVENLESGARTALDGRAYFSFGGLNRYILAGRAQVGALRGPEISGSPPEILFLSGGGGTVRGQPYQSLNVRSGRVTSGGKSFLGFNGEFRAGLSESVQLVAFFDEGHIGESSAFWDYDNTHYGAGLGFRYLTGFSPIRVDLASPVFEEDQGNLRIYVGLGQAF